MWLAPSSLPREEVCVQSHLEESSLSISGGNKGGKGQIGQIWNLVFKENPFHCGATLNGPSPYPIPFLICQNFISKIKKPRWPNVFIFPALIVYGPTHFQISRIHEVLLYVTIFFHFFTQYFNYEIKIHTPLIFKSVVFSFPSYSIFFFWN